MKKNFKKIVSVVVTMVVASLSISGCSSNKEEEAPVPQSEEWQLPDYDEKLINEGEPIELPEDIYELHESSEISQVKVEAAADVLAQLLNTLAERPVTAEKALAATGFTANQIILEGAGDEATAKIMEDALPMEFIDASDATLREKLIGYAYLLKISSLYASGSGMPIPLYVESSLIEVISKNTLFVPEGGKAIHQSSYDEYNLLPLFYIIATPFTLTETEEEQFAIDEVSTDSANSSESKESWIYTRWGVNIPKLAVSAVEIGDIPNDAIYQDVGTIYQDFETDTE